MLLKTLHILKIIHIKYYYILLDKQFGCNFDRFLDQPIKTQFSRKDSTSLKNC
jgi:hypothetical protein